MSNATVGSNSFQCCARKGKRAGQSHHVALIIKDTHVTLGAKPLESWQALPQASYNAKGVTAQFEFDEEICPLVRQPAKEVAGPIKGKGDLRSAFQA